MRERIGSPVRELRQNLGINQSEFAMILGCSSTFLYKIENGLVPLSPRIVGALLEIDADAAENIAQKYEEYMKQKKEEIKDRIKAKKSEK
ncbi:helix-turn-helix domain-containing protein [Candidatus Dojkabacteria bacterium]|nr:helix-turn-helix domain-containing protein [Candidatus Dojkabacteria bacterium]